MENDFSLYVVIELKFELYTGNPQVSILVGVSQSPTCLGF